MLVIAQFQERFTGNDATRLQSQPFSAGTNPMTMLRLILGVIIVMGQVLIKIRLRTTLRENPPTGCDEFLTT
jgi:hypothetical protein